MKILKSERKALLEGDVDGAVELSLRKLSLLPELTALDVDDTLVDELNHVQGLYEAAARGLRLAMTSIENAFYGTSNSHVYSSDGQSRSVSDRSRFIKKI